MSKKYLQGIQNFPLRVVMGECRPPLWIVLYCAVPMILDLALFLTLPQWDDIVRSYASAAAGGAVDGRGGKPGHLRRPKAEGKPSGRERYYQRGLRTLLLVTAPLEYIGFGLLLYGAANRGANNFQAFLDLSDACSKNPFGGSLARHDVNTAMLPNEVLGAMPASIEDYNTLGTGAGPFGADLPVGRYYVTIAAEVVNPGSIPASWRMGILVSGAPGISYVYDGFANVPGGTPTELLGTFEFTIPSFAGGSISWGIAGPTIPVGLTINRCRVLIQRTPPF